MTTAPVRHIPRHFPVAVHISIITAFTGVMAGIWQLAAAGIAVMIALYVVVVKREFFDDNTPDYYDYED